MSRAVSRKPDCGAQQKGSQPHVSRAGRMHSRAVIAKSWIVRENELHCDRAMFLGHANDV
jgi:hypothetical protein